MIKSIKWELRKQIHRSRSVLKTIPIAFLILLLLPASLMKTQNIVMTTVIYIITLVLMWGAICPVIFSISNLSCDFVKPTYLLDRSTGRSYMLLFLIKLLGSFMYILMTTLIVIIGRELIAKFNTENMQFFTAEINQPYYVFLLEFAYFYPITVVYLYLSVKSISQSKLLLAFLAVVTVGILYQSLSYAKANVAGYVVTIIILGVAMLWGSSRLAEKLILKS
jgi:hypothetical protein